MFKLQNMWKACFILAYNIIACGNVLGGWEVLSGRQSLSNSLIGLLPIARVGYNSSMKLH
jgi:hypothetical protein